jgi:hypothetical protein
MGKGLSTLHFECVSVTPLFELKSNHSNHLIRRISGSDNIALTMEVDNDFVINASVL